MYILLSIEDTTAFPQLKISKYAAHCSNFKIFSHYQIHRTKNNSRESHFL